MLCYEVTAADCVRHAGVVQRTSSDLRQKTMTTFAPAAADPAPSMTVLQRKLEKMREKAAVEKAELEKMQLQRKLLARREERQRKQSAGKACRAPPASGPVPRPPPGPLTPRALQCAPPSPRSRSLGATPRSHIADADSATPRSEVSSSPRGRQLREERLRAMRSISSSADKNALSAQARRMVAQRAKLRPGDTPWA